MKPEHALNDGAIARVFAGVTALAAFVIAILAGLSVGNTSSKILLSALFAMVVCYVVGSVIGMIAEYAVREHMRSYRDLHPVPNSEVPKPSSSQSSQG